MHRALLLLASEAIPVVDIDNTIFIQGAIFLVLIFVLKPLLFDPWLAARDRRTQRIGGALEEATLMRDQAAEKSAEYEARLRRAKDEALGLRATRRKTAEAEEAAMVAEARREAAEALTRAKALIEADVVKARVELQGRVESLAADVTKQVLGRPA
ncbi:ATP synthase F0 subunit B [Nannocystaceae bacterium ST9]